MDLGGTVKTMHKHILAVALAMATAPAWAGDTCQLDDGFGGVSNGGASAGGAASLACGSGADASGDLS
ncbi:adhesin, partial [Stenotrophomonas geniculata]